MKQLCFECMEPCSYGYTEKVMCGMEHVEPGDFFFQGGICLGNYLEVRLIEKLVTEDGIYITGYIFGIHHSLIHDNTDGGYEEVVTTHDSLHFPEKPVEGDFYRLSSIRNNLGSFEIVINRPRWYPGQ